MPIPDAILPPESVKTNIDDPETVRMIQESCNQLSRDYRDAWNRHVERLEKLGIKFEKGEKNG